MICLARLAQWIAKELRRLRHIDELVTGEPWTVHYDPADVAREWSMRNPTVAAGRRAMSVESMTEVRDALGIPSSACSICWGQLEVGEWCRACGRENHGTPPSGGSNVIPPGVDVGSNVQPPPDEDEPRREPSHAFERSHNSAICARCGLHIAWIGHHSIARPQQIPIELPQGRRIRL